MLDATHDPALRSWVPSAQAPDTDFPIQNLPLGVAAWGDGHVAIVVAIGDQVCDLARRPRQRSSPPQPT